MPHIGNFRFDTGFFLPFSQFSFLISYVDYILSKYMLRMVHLCLSVSLFASFYSKEMSLKFLDVSRKSLIEVGHERGYLS
jgi:hypothetical protein